MKNAIRIVGIIALAAVIGFTMAACKGDDGETDPTELRVSNEPVMGTTDSTDLAFVGPSSHPYPLNEDITGTPIVQVVGGKLTLALDAPYDSALGLIFDAVHADSSDITVTPTDAKWLIIKSFSNLSGDTTLWMKGPGAGEIDVTYLYYADKDVTINGTHTPNTYTNVTLKKGWNYLPVANSGSEFTYGPASQTKPAGATWWVVD
jgi:hypothetical protein